MMWILLRGSTNSCLKIASRGAPCHFSPCSSAWHLPRADGYSDCKYPRLLQRRSPSFSVAKRHSSTEPLTAYEQILSSGPVHSVQSAFTFCHDLTGFHWAGSIVATTLALRLLFTFPLSIYAQNIRGKVEKIQPEIVGRARYIFSQRYGLRMKQEKWTEKKAQRVFLGLVRLQAKEIYVRENCHPAKGSILFLTQLPLWIMMSLALRNMTGAFPERFYTDPVYIIPEFTSGGALWFHDLTVPDPYLVLPVMVGLLNLINIEMHALHRGRVTRFQRGVNYFLRGVSVLMIPIASFMPSSMALYWTISAIYSFGQNVTLKFPTVRRALRIAPSRTDSNTPFQDMREMFVKRYIRREKGEEDSVTFLDQSQATITGDAEKPKQGKPK